MCHDMENCAAVYLYAHIPNAHFLELVVSKKKKKQALFKFSCFGGDLTHLRKVVLHKSKNCGDREKQNSVMEEFSCYHSAAL